MFDGRLNHSFILFRLFLSIIRVIFSWAREITASIRRQDIEIGHYLYIVASNSATKGSGTYYMPRTGDADNAVSVGIWANPDAIYQVKATGWKTGRERWLNKSFFNGLVERNEWTMNSRAKGLLFSGFGWGCCFSDHRTYIGMLVR